MKGRAFTEREVLEGGGIEEEAGVGNGVKMDVMELGDLFAEVSPEVFEGEGVVVEAVHKINEAVEELGIGVDAGGARDGLGEFLEAELLIDEGSGFFENGEGGDDEDGVFGGGVGVGAEVDEIDFFELGVG